MPNELLPQKEKKTETLPIGDLSMPGKFNFKKFAGLIALRLSKLEKIKKFIALKTYHEILEKIDSEKAKLEKLSESSKKQQQKAEAPGLLPSEFFELAELKAKNIRID